MSWALLAFGDQFLLAFHDMEFAGNYRSLSVLHSPEQCNFTDSNRFHFSTYFSKKRGLSRPAHGMAPHKGVQLTKKIAVHQRTVSEKLWIHV